MVQELTKMFNDTILPVEVINEKEFMIDITGIAKSKGKKISEWVEGKRTKELLKLKVDKSTFKGNLIQTKQGKGGYTKIHNSMLISFARFISVEFEDWCDETIYQILTESKDKEIAKLKAEKKLCTIRDDGTTSTRGLAQRTKYTEAEIKTCFKELGGIKQEIRDTLFWSVKDPLKGIIVKDSEFGSPYFDYTRAIMILDQFYSEEEE